MSDRSIATVPVAAERRVHVLGCPVDALTLAETVAWVDRHLQIPGRPLVQHAALNAAKLVAMQKDAALREAVRRCGLISADGQSIVWAARWLGGHLPERVTGIDLMEALVELAARRGYRVYFLGARPPVVEAVVQRYRERYPRLVVAGWRDGYFRPDEEAGVVAAIRESGADILFVAMGTPQKELFLSRNLTALGVPFAMGVGGSFDVVAGLTKRAPGLWQQFGLEWLFRLIQEPRRMWRRYLVGNTAFLWLVIKARWQRGAATAAERGARSSE